MWPVNWQNPGFLSIVSVIALIILALIGFRAGSSASMEARLAEMDRAQAEHSIVAQALAACKRVDLRHTKASLRQQYLLGEPFVESWRVPPVRSSPGSALAGTPQGQSGAASPPGSGKPDDDPPLTEDEWIDHYGRTVVSLSRDIVHKRGDLAAAAVADFRYMSAFEITIVVLGAITTILTSLKSMADIKPPLNIWIGILAVFFSATVTATAALYSFYGVRENHSKDVRDLARLERLHTDMADTVTHPPLDKDGHCYSLARVGDAIDLLPDPDRIKARAEQEQLATNLKNWITTYQVLVETPGAAGTESKSP